MSEMDVQDEATTRREWDDINAEAERLRVERELLTVVDAKRSEYEVLDRTLSCATAIRDTLVAALDTQVDEARAEREVAWQAWGEALERLRKMG